MIDGGAMAGETWTGTATGVWTRMGGLSPTASRTWKMLLARYALLLHLRAGLWPLEAVSVESSSMLCSRSQSTVCVPGSTGGRVQAVSSRHSCYWTHCSVDPGSRTSVQVAAVAKDQNGCRFLQRKFDEGGETAIGQVRCLCPAHCSLRCIYADLVQLQICLAATCCHTCLGLLTQGVGRALLTAGPVSRCYLRC